jgi:hypothetical protein
MNKQELYVRLIQEQLQADAYWLDGELPNEALTLNEEHGRWQVYYSERGQKTNLQEFDTETQACTYFCQAISEMLGSK